MAVATKDARHITVGATAYRWRARGTDDGITLAIWPRDLPGAKLFGRFAYGQASSSGQLVVTNRLVQQVIELAIAHGYDPAAEDVREIVLGDLDLRIDLTDAVRASR